MTFKYLLRIYLRVAFVCAVLYSLVGPLFDHHFAERLPYHSHIFLVGVAAEHVHPGESSHEHSGVADGNSNVVFAAETTAQGSATVVLVYLAMLMLLAAVEPRLLTISACVASFKGVRPVYFKPPSPPPQLAT